MKDAEGSRRALLHFRRALLRVFFEVQVVHARLEHVAAENTNHEQSHEEEQDQAVERAPRVKPLRDQLADRNRRTPLLHNEIALNKQLCRRAGMRSAEQTNHFVREKYRPGGEGEKYHRPEPHCRIHDRNDA